MFFFHNNNSDSEEGNGLLFRSPNRSCKKGLSDRENYVKIGDQLNGSAQVSFLWAVLNLHNFD